MASDVPRPPDTFPRQLLNAFERLGREPGEAEVCAYVFDNPREALLRDTKREICQFRRSLRKYVLHRLAGLERDWRLRTRVLMTNRPGERQVWIKKLVLRDRAETDAILVSALTLLDPQGPAP